VLAQIFALAAGGLTVMNNHLHLLLRVDPKVAEAWSDEEVVRRWGRLYPPRDKSRKPLPVTEAWVQGRLKETRWVAKARERLQSISWFILSAERAGRCHPRGTGPGSSAAEVRFSRALVQPAPGRGERASRPQSSPSCPPFQRRVLLVTHGEPVGAHRSGLDRFGVSSRCLYRGARRNYNRQQGVSFCPGRRFRSRRVPHVHLRAIRRLR
jgi:hypothetical protein